MDALDPISPALLGACQITSSNRSSVNRVRNTAMRLSRDLQARGETEIDDLLVELVALFHDMAGESVRVLPCIGMDR
jgi:hypothetical protein